MDCSAAIDRIEWWKDTNMVGGWYETRSFQCKDDWKGKLSIVELFENF